ncbi:alpha/beta hydrolase [Streptomyces sp. HUAS MG47]|uniref:alpha/beta hydrolase n=1 Tax=Streptomyces solicamelliae TaxID=3231716 RepID=UPI003877B1E5
MNVVVRELDPHAVSTALARHAAALDPDLRVVPADRLTVPVPFSAGKPVTVLHLVGSDDGLRDRQGVVPADVVPAGVSPEIVVLDSCYVPSQADTVAEAVPVVIGLPGRLGRVTADAFLGQWYAALGQGAAADAAFEAACDRIGAGDLPEPLQPRLHRQGEAGTVFRSGRSAGAETVTVWFGTNRIRLDDGGFGDRASSTLHRGSCTVEVPASAPVGGRPRRRLGRVDGRRRLEFVGSRTLDREAYLTAVSDALDDSLNDRRAVFVYVHGYRTTFDEAAVRAAQLHMDLKIPGVTAFFSWPSRGTAHGYSADEDAVQLSERHLCEFLLDLCAKSSAKKVHLLAHSMGSRAVLRVAMRAAENSSRTQGIELGQLILAAPDIDGAFFASEADSFRHIAEGTTLYTSSRDLALQSSSIVHRGPRAGQGPSLPCTEAMHVIDAAPIDVSLLGHGYYAAAFPVLGDIHSLIYDRHDPSARMALRSLGEGRWGFRELN